MSDAPCHVCGALPTQLYGLIVDGEPLRVQLPLCGDHSSRWLLRVGMVSASLAEGWPPIRRSVPLVGAIFEYDVPEHTMKALQAWINKGHVPGDFVLSVLRNDLQGAAMRADAFNAPRLPAIINFLNMEAPSPCWGSPEKVEEWRKRFPQEPEP